jgi:hypothetical protein
VGRGRERHRFYSLWRWPVIAKARVGWWWYRACGNRRRWRLNWRLGARRLYLFQKFIVVGREYDRIRI